MKGLNTLPDRRRQPPGLEWTLLRRLPLILVAGTLLPTLAALASRLWPPAGLAVDSVRYFHMIDIVAIAVVVTVWGMALTTAIGCCVVVLTKGPGYVADRYDLVDADQPRRP